MTMATLKSKNRGLVLCLGLGLTVALAACNQPVRVHGYIPDPEDIEQIQTGLHSREDILGLLGSPSTVSTFEEYKEKWYYIGQKSTQFAYERPDIFERSILEITYDDSGFVEETRSYDLADGRKIDPVDRVTPTEGRDFTVLQQLLGNFGRLPSGALPSGATNLPGP